MFAVVLIIVLLAIDPPTVLMLGGLFYVFSGLVITVMGRREWRLRRLKRLRRRQAAEAHRESKSSGQGGPPGGET
ncbi:MAG: hypothetical protein GWN87_08240 [Desulfuromonadales bacterium]|nr:hypothetical protein [Desulfuromonadales bacterium]